MKLNHKKMGSGQPIIILHGLFGMLDNWQSIGRELSDDFEVWLVDQRNHGHSPHRNSHTYTEMAEDLKGFIDDEQIEDPIVVGHSMGGKTAMRCAQMYPDSLKSLVVVDMGIKEYPIHHDNIVEALKSVPVESVESRSEAEDYLKKHIDEMGIRQFLLKNLNRKSEGNYRWRFNLDVLDKDMPEIVAALPDEKVEIPILFIRGKRSNYIADDDLDSLKNLFPKGEFEILDSGHWVHAEQPKAVIGLIREFAG